MNIIEKLEALQKYAIDDVGCKDAADYGDYILVDDLRAIIEEAKKQEPIGYVSQYTRKFLIAGSIGYIYPSKLEDNDLGVFTHPQLSDEAVKDK